MKKLILIAASLSLTSGVAFAHGNEEHHEGPCKKIAEACETAGFKKGEHEKNHKGLWLDCIRPLMDGKKVAGVNVTDGEIKACHEMKEKMHGHEHHADKGVDESKNGK